MEIVFLVIQVVLSAIIGVLVKTIWDHGSRINKVEITNATILANIGNIGDNVREIKENSRFKFDKIFDDLEEIKVTVSRLPKR